MTGRFQALWEDPNARARLLRWFWLISLATLILGYALIVLFFLGR